MKTAVVLLATMTALVLAGRAAFRDTSAEAAPTTSQDVAVRSPRPDAMPIVRQAFRNNCETAALSMLLASVGVRVDQRQLQRALRRSGPLDPRTASDGTVTWGDPDQGFVGRVRGGGVAGGFGVYQGPIRQLAARYGVRLTDLSRRPVAELLSTLRAGRPVMTWIGLSQGPYRRWVSPAGKPIVVNFGEHVVVLVRLTREGIVVNDPLNGTRKTWSVAAFTKMWKLLGRRALGV